MKRLAGLFFVAVLLAGCGSAKEGFNDGKNGDAKSNDGTLQISRATFGESWPFTVDSGLLSCRPSPDNPKFQAVVFGPGDTAYAVNGTAKSLAAENGWKPIDEIWADNPDNPGTKMNISPIIERGIELCK